MYDAIIISDLHLGADICRVKSIIDLLNHLPETKLLILNGDVLENTEHRLAKSHWKVLSILRKISDTVKIIHIKGNHCVDAESIAHLIGADFVKEYIFESGNAKFLCIHGDKWDKFITEHPILTWIGDLIYTFFQYWNSRFAVHLKQNSKTFLHCVDKVKKGAKELCKTKKCDFVLTGHTHHAEIDGNYANSGSWTEPICNLLLVKDGVIELKDYHSSSEK